MAAPCAFKGRFGFLNVAHLPFTSLVWLFRPNAQRESNENPGRRDLLATEVKSVFAIREGYWSNPLATFTPYAQRESMCAVAPAGRYFMPPWHHCQVVVPVDNLFLTGSSLYRSSPGPSVF
jgi:hypothetical protein